MVGVARDMCVFFTMCYSAYYSTHDLCFGCSSVCQDAALVYTGRRRPCLRLDAFAGRGDDAFCFIRVPIATYITTPSGRGAEDLIECTKYRLAMGGST